MDKQSDEEECTQYVKILTFGDSLTEGFHRSGFAFHPYAIELERSIDAKFADKRKQVLVHQFGQSGEFTDHMVPRLSKLLNKAVASSYPYGVVCILAGTNDLSSGDTADEIFTRLEELYDMVLAHGTGYTVLVAITIPQASFSDAQYMGTRNAVNAKIKQYCTDKTARRISTAVYGDGDCDDKDHDRDRGNVVCVDLEQAIPYHSPRSQQEHTDTVTRTETVTGQTKTVTETGTEMILPVYWDDDLHMTPAGYDHFGRLVFTSLEHTLEALLT
jgi:lysophospholipase L1-like esterase